MRKNPAPKKLIEDFLEISHRLRQGGLTFGAGGGISARIPRSSKVLIKGWEVASEDAREKDISLVDLEGKQLNHVKPCLETHLHLETLKVREDIRAVIHAHSPYLTSFGKVKKHLPKGRLRNYPFLNLSTDFAPYADPGSKELAHSVAGPFRKEEVICVIMEDHGVTVVGADLFKAYYRLDILEGMAKTFILTEILLETIKNK
ncbi:MAG: class II aldolase/adducin family protein [Syntrophaceae bacterium]|nr:class II aldolase/adducin family protein [Syntrophaceae bacterium]